MPILELPGLVVDNVAAVVSPSALALINRDPCPGETGVPIDSTVGLEVVDTGSDGVDRAATRVFIGGVLAFDDSLVPEVRPGFDGSRASVAETADTLSVVLDPTTPFASQAVVSVRVVSVLVGGAVALDEVYSFAIEDRTAPRVVAAQATAQNIVQVGFDEPVVASGAAAFTFVPLDLPAVPIAVVGAESIGSVVQVDLDTEMTPDVRYRVSAAGVTDVHGKPRRAALQPGRVRGLPSGASAGKAVRPVVDAAEAQPASPMRPVIPPGVGSRVLAERRPNHGAKILRRRVGR